MTNPSFAGVSWHLGTLLATPIKRTIASIIAAHRTRRARVDATALDDRLLADVGLSRTQIWSAADAAHAEAGERVNSPSSRRRPVGRFACRRLPS